MMASMASLHSLTPEYVANEDKLNDEFDFGSPAPVMNAGGGLRRSPSALTMDGTMNGTQHPPSLDNDNPMSKFMAITGTIKVPKPLASNTGVFRTCPEEEQGNNVRAWVDSHALFQISRVDNSWRYEL